MVILRTEIRLVLMSMDNTLDKQNDTTNEKTTIFHSLTILLNVRYRVSLV